MTADRAALERVLAGSGVEQTPAPPEASYVQELWRAFSDAFWSSVGKLNLPQGVLAALAWGLAALALGLALWVAWGWWRRRAGRSGNPEAMGTLTLRERESPPAWRTAAEWRAELDRRLSDGRVAEALEALWWWLARSLAGDRVESDWTSRDLVAQAGRREVRDLMRRLDAYTYGPRPPALDDLRSLVRRLEEVIA